MHLCFDLTEWYVQYQQTDHDIVNYRSVYVLFTYPIETIPSTILHVNKDNLPPLRYERIYKNNFFSFSAKLLL